MKTFKRVLRYIISMMAIIGMILCTLNNRDTVMGAIVQFIVGVFMMIPFIVVYWDMIVIKE